MHFQLCMTRASAFACCEGPPPARRLTVGSVCATRRPPCERRTLCGAVCVCNRPVGRETDCVLTAIAVISNSCPLPILHSEGLCLLCLPRDPSFKEPPRRKGAGDAARGEQHRTMRGKWRRMQMEGLMPQQRQLSCLPLPLLFLFLFPPLSSESARFSYFNTTAGSSLPPTTVYPSLPSCISPPALLPSPSSIPPTPPQPPHVVSYQVEGR